MVRKGGAVVVQHKMQWAGRPTSVATWEDYELMRQRFPAWDSWGQASSSGAATIMSGAATMPTSGDQEDMIDSG
jgi:hypothetical protein